MKFIIFITFLLLINLVYAETTFSDNPDDVLIMGGSATGKVIDAETATGENGCLYKWNCTDWSACLQSGKQIRNCTNAGTCADFYKSPEINRSCSYVPSEIEEEEEKLEAEKDSFDNSKIFISLGIILTTIFILVYLNRNFLRKIIKNRRLYIC